MSSTKSAVVLASHNRGKAKEFADLLGPFQVTMLTLADFPHLPEVEETGVTFEENSRLKARAISLATGKIAIADDSGLCVDALDGAPGVYSARYSEAPGIAATDAKNNAKLLLALNTVTGEDRSARFCCCITAMAPSGASITGHGFWEGHIADAPRGLHGFGYDPLFLDPETGKTAAELLPEEKNTRSHRHAAVADLLEKWPEFWARCRQQK